MEEFKDIKGYEGLYKISNTGKVKSLRREMWNGVSTFLSKEKNLKPRVKDNKYLYVGLSKNKEPKNHYVHRLVAQAFIPNPECKKTVNHINGDVTDNRVENLEWATQGENNKHAYDKLSRKPAPNYGLKNGMSKLTPTMVKDIRNLYKTGGVNASQLSRYYNVTRPCIVSVLERKTWKNVI